MSNQPMQSYPKGAYTSLMRGISELDLRRPAVPCYLVLIGDHAFPLAINSQGQVLMAASLYGRGRVVVLGHEDYLTPFPALTANALTWLRGDGSENISVGVHKNVKWVADHISRSSFQVEVVGALSDNPGVGVYVTDAYSVGSDPKDLAAFLKAGGGVLIAGQAWNWASYHNENSFLHFPGNKVAGVAGIYFVTDYGTAENLPVYPDIPSHWKAIDIGKKFKKDLEFLLKGILEFNLQGDFAASEVLVHGPLSFPIGTTDDGRAFLAGAYYGRGRVIVATHESFMNMETLASFWNNAVQWLDQGRDGVVGFAPAVNIFTDSGLKCEKTEFRKDLSVFVCTAYTDEHVKEIQDFVAEGGGLLIGGHSWYWAHTHQGQNPLTDFSGNKILNKLGLSLLVNTIGNGLYEPCVKSQATRDKHFRYRLRRVAGHVIHGNGLSEKEEKHLQKLGMDCAQVLTMKAFDSFSYTQVRDVLIDILKRSDVPQVSENNPVRSPWDLFLTSLVKDLYNVCPDPDALLPYIIKQIPVRAVVYNQRIRINAQTAENEEWISTGLYLSPGMKTYMIIPEKMVNKRWMVQIGCQSDFLEAEELKRAPCVLERFPVTSEVMQVQNLWGGLIYLVAPPDTYVEEAEVIVQIAVRAPYYKSGVTTAADWSVLRAAPSPWAELEFDNIILTVPSDVVRDLERPDEVATLWNGIMEGIADLAVIPRKFPRKERIVADVQISGGCMHSGYPVMMHSTIAAELVKPNDARTKGLWGEIFALGHNQQRDCWEFPPHTTAATCNLWSVYVHEEVLKVNRAQAHPNLTETERQRRIEEYVEGGRKLSSWEVFVALETYLQLQERFGWDAFKKVFAAYHDMSNFPSDNTGKMNLYAETFSQKVGMNLTGFFKAWGWPIETSTEEKLSRLPPWCDHPMVQHD